MQYPANLNGCSKKIKYKSIKSLNINIKTEKDLDQIKEHKFDTIINATGFTDVNGCEKNIWRKLLNGLMNQKRSVLLKNI